MNITKPLTISKRDPAIIFIGNSRNLYGLDLAQIKLFHTYNLSLRGAGIDEIALLFKHAALTTTSIKEAYLSLDDVCSDLSENDVLDQRFIVTEEGSSSYFNGLLLHTSYQSTVASIDFLLNGNQSSLDDHGRQTLFNEFGYGPGNYSYALAARDKANAKSFESLSIGPAPDFENFRATCNTSGLWKILAEAQKNSIKLVFFINPENMRYWEIRARAGRSREYLYTRQIISDTLDNFSRKYGRSAPKVYDFNIASAITRERLTADSAKNAEFWYESSHHKKPVGDIMLRTFFTDTINDGPYHVLLKSGNLVKNFEHSMSDFEVWQKNSPGVIAEIEEILKGRPDQEIFISK